MKATILTLAMATAAFVAAAPASAQSVGYNTLSSTFNCGTNMACMGTGTNAVTIGSLGLGFAGAFSIPTVTAPTAISLGTITATGTGNATLDGITLNILINSMPGGSGTLPGGDIVGTLSGTSANAQITWSSSGVTLGNFLYTVTNSPLSLVAPTSFGVAGPGTTSIQGYVRGVPEPATWAMMLLGFGAIGFSMRRRRSPVLAQVA